MAQASSYDYQFAGDRAEQHRKVWNRDVASKIQTVGNHIGQTTSFFTKSFGKKFF